MEITFTAPLSFKMLEATPVDYFRQSTAHISRQATEDMKIIGPLNRAALVAIRKDLGLPIDANWLNNLSDTHSKDVFTAVEKFQQNVEK